MKAMTYVAKNTGFEKLGDFMSEWKPLGDEDREVLKQWARAECAALKITLED